MKKYLLLIIIFSTPLTAFALAPVGPYDTISTAAGNWGVNGTAATSHEYLFNGQQYRIRQTGSIQRIQMYVSTLSHVTSVYYTVWRNVSGTWTLIGTSQNLLPSLTAGQTNTVDLTSPISAEMGDYYGYRITWDGTGSRFATANTGITGMSGYLYADSATTSTGFNWGAQTSFTSAVPIIAYMDNPVIVFNGDSIIQGAPNNYAFTQNLTTTNIPSTIEYKVANPEGWTFQNIGHGGDNTTQIAARRTTYCVNLNPQYCVFDGGVNDKNQAVSTSTFQTNWTNILSTVSAAGITPVVMLITPWTNGTNAQNYEIDDWNTWLTSTAASYGAIVVNTRQAVGQFRTGGSVGNLWDIQAPYQASDGLGVHYTEAGNQQLANAIRDAMGLNDRVSILRNTGSTIIRSGRTATIRR